jgi:hypothetical protein
MNAFGKQGCNLNYVSCDEAALNLKLIYTNEVSE